MTPVQKTAPQMGEQRLWSRSLPTPLSVRPAEQFLQVSGVITQIRTPICELSWSTFAPVVLADVSHDLLKVRNGTVGYWNCLNT